MAIPARGDVWIVDLGLAHKSRPALVVSREYGENDRALITVVPHTTALRGSEFEVSIDARFLAKPGAFMTQGITSVPAVHATRRLGALTAEQVAAVEEQIRSWLRL